MTPRYRHSSRKRQHRRSLTRWLLLLGCIGQDLTPGPDQKGQDTVLKKHRGYTMGEVYDALEARMIELSRKGETESALMREVRWSTIDSLQRARQKLRWACRRLDERRGDK